MSSRRFASGGAQDGVFGLGGVDLLQIHTALHRGPYELGDRILWRARGKPALKIDRTTLQEGEDRIPAAARSQPAGDDLMQPLAPALRRLLIGAQQAGRASSAFSPTEAKCRSVRGAPASCSAQPSRLNMASRRGRSLVIGGMLGPRCLPFPLRFLLVASPPPPRENDLARGDVVLTACAAVLCPCRGPAQPRTDCAPAP